MLTQNSNLLLHLQILWAFHSVCTPFTVPYFSKYSLTLVSDVSKLRFTTESSCWHMVVPEVTKLMGIFLFVN